MMHRQSRHHIASYLSIQLAEYCREEQNHIRSATAAADQEPLEVLDWAGACMTFRLPMMLWDSTASASEPWAGHAWPEASWLRDRFSMMLRMPPLPERWLLLMERMPSLPEECGKLFLSLLFMLCAESLMGCSLSCTGTIRH